MSQASRAQDRINARAARVLIDGRLVAVRAKKHGSAVTCRNHGCQCVPCTVANNDRGKARRQHQRPAGKPAKLQNCARHGCRKRVLWREGDTPESYAARPFHDDACRVAAEAFEWPIEQLRRCALADCDAPVPRGVGEGAAHYARRHHCTVEHRRVAQGRTNTGRRAPWRTEVRTCATAGCEETFTPERREQKHHDHECSVKGRTRGKPREMKVCACPCGVRFERPAGVGKEAWDKRRFASPECYAAWRADRPSPAREGRRRAPRVVPSRDRKRKAKPPVAVPEPVRFVPTPVVPVRVEPVHRTTRPRPSFGISRRAG